MQARSRLTRIISHFSTSQTRTMVTSVEPTKLGKSIVTSNVEMDKGRWIGLRQLSWTDQEGREREWEMAERKTTGSYI